MEIRKNVRSASSNIEGKQFTIKASAKAFRILSDGLYSDKIRAIIRELSTNAYDAHVAAGNSHEPFRVHLPYSSSDELYFSIRDFGNSMTHHQVIELYTTYFGSDKTDSNEFVGALGLGSKSPFSYTDSFTVTAILDGDKRHYVAFMDETGTPTISLLNQNKTSERNGVEIRFDINEEDVDAFKEKAKSVYRFFPVKPEISGYPHYEHYSDIVFLESDTWKIIDSSRYSTTCFAIQGNIAYRVDSNQIRHPKASFIAENSFHVHFNIGDLDVSASREDLSYDKVTIENIINRFSEVYDEFIEKINQMIDLEKNEWSAKLKAASITKSLNVYGKNIIFSYKGEPLKNLDGYKISFQDFPNVSVIKYWKYSTYRTEMIKREDLTKRTDRWGTNDGFLFPVGDKCVFVVADDSTLKIPRVRYLAETTGKSVFLIEGATRKFYNAIGNPEKVELKTLAKPPRKTATPFENKKLYCFLQSHGFDYNAVSLNELPEGEKYYVEIKSDKITRNGQKVPLLFLKTNMQLAAELGLIDSESCIVGVAYRETQTKRFQKLGMINLFEFIQNKTKQKVDEIKKEIDFHYMIKSKFDSISSMSRISRDIISRKEVIDSLSPSSKAHELYTRIISIQEEYEEASAESGEIMQVIKLANNIGVRVDIPQYTYDVDDFETHYPMLGMVNTYNYDFHKIIEYIKMVDHFRDTQK